MSIDINLTIEDMVKEKKLSYMDAILEYAQNIDGEIEEVAKLLNKSIKDKLELEAQKLHMMKQTSKLPL
tara:strand:+ start:64 stop:270 length:207 start_codon:yes stop_codon:yes gene_type:complete